MRLLSRRPVNDPRFLLLTGSVQQERAQRLLGMRPAAFRPQHSHKLGEACLTELLAGCTCKCSLHRRQACQPVIICPAGFMTVPLSTGAGNEFYLYASVQPSEQLGGMGH